METLRDIWMPEGVEWSLDNLSEEQGPKVVDGVHVIGRVTGQFFVPGGDSLNKRHYPTGLWESVLASERVKGKLEGKMMFGMLGHEDKPITEDDLAKGRVSHIISKLFISPTNKSAGMGEALILGTEAGRNLLTYFKAGAKLKTSSRASGEYNGTTSEGIPIVDKNRYILETFDFVINPGFKEVNLNLVENKEPSTPILTMEPDVKKLMESRDALQEQVLSMLSENRTLREENVQFKTQNPKHEAAVKLLKVLEDAEVTADVVQDIVSAADTAGIDADKLASVISAITEPVAQAIAAAGTPSADGDDGETNPTVEESLKQLAAYKEIGSISEINSTSARAAKLLKEFLSIGKDPKALASKISEQAKLLEGYQALGKVEDIKKIQEEHSKALKESESKAIDLRVKTLSEKLAQPLDRVRRLVEAKLDDKAIEETFADSGSKAPVLKTGRLNEEELDSTGLQETAAGRLFESYTGARRPQFKKMAAMQS